MKLNLDYRENFTDRHIGPGAEETQEMLKVVGAQDLNQLMDQTLPATIRNEQPLPLS